MVDLAAPLGMNSQLRNAVPPMMPLNLRDVSLCLNGQKILDRVSLDLGASGCTMLMGPNGAGKSQLFRVLHGLQRPDAGVIDWHGVAPAEVRLRQAMVFQTPVLLRRSAGANVDFVLRARGKDRGRVADLLTLVGLDGKAHHPARLLSGGEQQCLALARALATDPDVLFLDEPTASLAPAAVQIIEDILRDVLRRGVRVIFITHDAGQARRIADDVVFLHRGRVAVHVPATSFFANPPEGVARAYLDGDIIP